MNQDELTNWALENGWRMIANHPSLTKPFSPKEPIVRMVLKATVVNLEAPGSGRKSPARAMRKSSWTLKQGYPWASASIRFQASRCLCRRTRTGWSLPGRPAPRNPNGSMDARLVRCWPAGTFAAGASLPDRSPVSAYAG
jgi:hypothetical protein